MTHRTPVPTQSPPSSHGRGVGRDGTLRDVEEEVGVPHKGSTLEVGQRRLLQAQVVLGPPPTPSHLSPTGSHPYLRPLHSVSGMA